jgi:putative transposase
MNKDRKNIRLRGYDYSQYGWYFITICVYNRYPVLGDVRNATVILSAIGKQADRFWQELPQHFGNVKLDQYIIMPNHVHGVILITDEIKNVGVQNFEPLQHKFQHIIPRSIGSAVRTYKAAVTSWCKNNRFANFKWQRNYYEHIARSEEELSRIREYIRYNPVNWALDRENPLSKNFNIEHDRYWKGIYETDGSKNTIRQIQG